MKNQINLSSNDIENICTLTNNFSTAYGKLCNTIKELHPRIQDVIIDYSPNNSVNTFKITIYIYNVKKDRIDFYYFTNSVVDSLFLNKITDLLNNI